MLETILDITIDRVDCINAQKILNYSTEEKSLRLDVFLKDGQRICYDLEMETSANKSRLIILPIRSRLYSSAIDTEVYPRGTHYSDVKQTYIIFICTHDPFGLGLAKYDSAVTCTQNQAAEVQNGISYVYLNCDAKTWNVSEDLRSLLSYIRDGTNCETDLTKQIDSAVRHYNEDKEWRNGL